MAESSRYTLYNKINSPVVKIISLLPDEIVIDLLFYDSVPVFIIDFVVGASSVKRNDALNWKENL
jgi:hypothetical protein